MSRRRNIIWLCPGIEYDKPNTGGLQYNHIFLDALKQRFSGEYVESINLLPARAKLSWMWERIFLNIVYLKYLFRMKLTPDDLLIVDSGVNSQVILPIIAIRFFRKTPVLMTVFHLTFPLTTRKGFKRWLQCSFEKAFIRCATHIVTISQSTRSAILDILKSGEKESVHIEIVHPGLNKPNQGQRVIEKRDRAGILRMVTVGSCDDPRKGLDILLIALGSIIEVNFHLSIVGGYSDDNSFHKYLLELVDRYKLNGSVEFLGRISNESLVDVLCQSDLFVFPSLWEGYGIALAEAMSYGLPIISTDTGAIPELVINGKNGILVPPGDTSALAKAILLLTSNQSLRITFGRNNFVDSHKFKDWREVGQLLADHVESILNLGVR